MWDDTKVARIAISCLRGQALKWIERIDHKDADGTNEFFQQPDIPKTPITVRNKKETFPVSISTRFLKYLV